MAAEASVDLTQRIRLQTRPERYRHWRLSVSGEIATLAMDVAEDGGLGDYVLKQNSYDLAVDIELADAIERLRFEHPEVKAVVITGLKDKVFCSGANIFMLGSSSHAFKVNFCKMTNETRLGMEDASAVSGLKFLSALNGTAAGGGYELALACDDIVLLDDASSAVSFPEVPLLGVLPGTGGLTRITDKRRVRRDLCDVFSTVAEGVKGKRALEWKLVDAIAPKSTFADVVQKRARALAERSDRPGAAASGTGVVLDDVEPTVDGTSFSYTWVTLLVDPKKRTAEITLKAPAHKEPSSGPTMLAKGNALWALRCYRELDDAILRLRLQFDTVGVVVLKTEGDPAFLLEFERALLASQDHWFAREVLAKMKRVLKRIDVTSRSFVSLVEPGSCFAGSLADLLFLADRSYMLDDAEADAPARIWLSSMNAGPLPMGNGLTRLQTRFYGDEASLVRVEERCADGGAIDPHAAEKLGIVTFVRDEIDYPDEVRLFLEERSALSPDALTGMEQNLRWPGPETMETRIFGRLSAWQNWIFIRDNATGPKGALTSYGKPERAVFDMRRT